MKMSLFVAKRLVSIYKKLIGHKLHFGTGQLCRYRRMSIYTMSIYEMFALYKTKAEKLGPALCVDICELSIYPMSIYAMFLDRGRDRG